MNDDDDDDSTMYVTVYGHNFITIDYNNFLSPLQIRLLLIIRGSAP